MSWYHGIATSCPIVPFPVISPYVMSICVIISQCMLCHCSVVCCEIALRTSVVVLCVRITSLPCGTVIHQLLVVAVSCCFGLAVIVVVAELPLSPFKC